MKKLLLFVIALTLGLGLKAQCPLSTAVDFTATDCHGTQVHLFDILDGGQYVLIDFFFTTCVPCQQATPKVVESYSAFGCNMHDVFYMEISDRDSDAACQTWCQTYGVEYPTISGAAGGSTICNQYQISYYPTVILIAPDRSIVINDLWPINNAQTVITALENHGIQQHDCNAAEIMSDFTGIDINGYEFNLYSVLDGGQAVLINFFLYGDPFSENVMPDILNAFHNYGCNDLDVFFLEITPNGHDSDAHDWVKQFGVQYPTISRDGGGNDIAQSIPVALYPTLMLIRPDHTIVTSDIYPPTYEYISQFFDTEGYTQYSCESGVEEENGAPYTLFPNPANESVTVKGDLLGKVSVYNTLGQKVEEFLVEGDELTINTAKYENGVYVIKTGEKTMRFVVKH